MIYFILYIILSFLAGTVYYYVDKYKCAMNAVIVGMLWPIVLIFIISIFTFTKLGKLICSILDKTPLKDYKNAW